MYYVGQQVEFTYSDRVRVGEVVQVGEGFIRCQHFGDDGGRYFRTYRLDRIR